MCFLLVFNESSLCSFFACGPCYDLLWLLVLKVTTYTIGILLYIIGAGMYLPFFTIFLYAALSVHVFYY